MRRSSVLRRVLLPVVAVACLRAGGSDTASVSGMVVNDVTGKPIHTALVVLSTTGAKPVDAMVLTDSSGSFSFNGVPPGHYYLHADNDGYQHVWFGAPTPDRYPAVLTVTAGEVRQGIALRLRPLASVSGLLLDQDGDPLPNTNVQLLASTWSRGKRTWQPRNGATSNQRGEFRIHSVAPGRYVLGAGLQGRQPVSTSSDVSLGDTQPEMTYARVYYPNATRIADAQQIEVKPGADVQDISLSMVAVPTATVNCRIEMPEGLSAETGVQVMFFPRDEVSGALGAANGGYTPNGTLSIAGLVPEHYRVITGVQGSSEYRGVEEVDVRPGSQDVVLHLTKGARLAGHLELQGPGAGDIAKYNVVLLAGDSPVFGPNRLSVLVQPDGSFAFPAVMPGIWDIDVQPVPKGGYVKSMKLGDQDVLTEEMNITPGTAAPLNIVVSSQGGVVTGAVKQPENPAAELTGRSLPWVLLAPTGRYSHVLSFFILRAAVRDGTYEIRGITPGSYRAFAFERFDRAYMQDGDFMARIEPLGKPVEVREGEQIHLDLDVQPGPLAGVER